MMKSGCFYGIGLGPGDPGLVTLKAWQILQQVDVIFAAAASRGERSVSAGIVAALPGVKAPVTELAFSMALDHATRERRAAEHAERIAVELAQGRNCAFVTIGDPLTYSTCSALLRALRRRCPEATYEVIPGVNAWSALAAARQEPLAEDRDFLKILPALDEEPPPPEPGGTTVYLKTYHTRDRCLKHLQKGDRLLYGEHIGLKDEYSASDEAAVRERPENYLSLLAVRRSREES